jgi:hypothetical protein
MLKIYGIPPHRGNEEPYISHKAESGRANKVGLNRTGFVP